MGWMQSVTSRTGHCAHVHSNHLVLLGGCPSTGHERVSLPRLLKAAAVPEAKACAPPATPHSSLARTTSRVDNVLTMMARACPPAARCGARPPIFPYDQPRMAALSLTLALALTFALTLT